VETNVKYHSNQNMTDQFIAKIVSKITNPKNVVVTLDLTEVQVMVETIEAQDTIKTHLDSKKTVLQFTVETILERQNIRQNSRDYNPNNSNLFYSTLRTKLFAVIGEKKCANCGFDDERALGFGQTDDVASFDYIQRAGPASSWEKYISDPDLAKKELRVFCLNCNMIKQKE